MKKLIISFIILLIFGVTAFIIGFVHIPPGYHALIYTTLFGFEEKVYFPEERLWRWEKLLPTVFTLYKYDLSPYKTELESPVKGSFYPSGNDYAAALGEDFNFTFDLDIFVEFTINPDKLLMLAQDGLLPENIPAWYEKISLQLSEQIFRIILKDPEIFIKLKRSEYLKRIHDIIGDNNDFAGLTLLAVDPKNVNIPDFDAYNALKEKYLEQLKVKTGIRNEMLNAEKELYLEAIQKEIDIVRNIERYGEVLTTYPAIMDFLHEANREYLREILDDTE